MLLLLVLYASHILFTINSFRVKYSRHRESVEVSILRRKLFPPQSSFCLDFQNAHQQRRQKKVLLETESSVEATVSELRLRQRRRTEERQRREAVGIGVLPLDS